MLPFDQLTAAGRIRRLGRLAAAVAQHGYGLAPSNVHLVSAHSFNTVFRIESPAGRMALRIGDSVRIHPDGVEDIEALWLDQLADSEIGSLRNVPTTTGARWVLREQGGIPAARVCTVFTWIEGSELRGRATAASITAAGRLLAELHEHASADGATSVPDELHQRQAVYFGHENLVAGFDSEHGDLFRDAIGRVQGLVDEFWKTRPAHLLHGDFGPHNIMSWRNLLRPIDFQDLRFGAAAHDVAITLADLGRSSPELAAPFMAGYAQVRGLPDLSSDQLATLAAGRSLNIMNLALLTPTSGIGQALASHQRRVIAWMTGVS